MSLLLLDSVFMVTYDPGIQAFTSWLGEIFRTLKKTQLLLHPNEVLIRITNFNVVDEGHESHTGLCG